MVKNGKGIAIENQIVGNIINNANISSMPKKDDVLVKDRHTTAITDDKRFLSKRFVPDIVPENSKYFFISFFICYILSFFNCLLLHSSNVIK